MINHTIPEDEKAYLHRVGRTGRAGHSGIAVTFVDWDDLHRWSLISKALELGEEDPRETYSSSPHLFEELDIPEGTKGRLPGASTRGNDAPPKEASRSSRSRSRSRKRTTDGGAESATAESPAEGTSASEGGEPSRAPRPRRRRRRGGSGEGSAPTEASAE